MLRKRQDRIGLATVTAMLLASGGALAAPAVIWVAKNGASVIDLETEAGAVTVANPDIADVTPMGGKRLIIMGRTVGQTDLLVYDRAGARLLATRLTVTPQLNGAVVVHRGVEEDTLVCAPVCASVSPRQNAASGGGSPADALKGALGGALGGLKPQE